MIIDNILDERYYKANEIEADVPKMLDPHNMIVFFKSEIQVAIQDQYQEVCEQIKMLKENHIFVKDAH